MDNIVEQVEEIEALKSIYDDTLTVETSSNSYAMQINPNVKLFFTLTEGYPSNTPPIFELLAPTLSIHQKQQITDDFQKIFMDNKGSPILYQWIEKLKEIADTNLIEESTSVLREEIPVYIPANTRKMLDIVHGDIIQDRKSVFQGHACQVESLEDTKIFLSCLLDNKKIAQATHNISAYRILTEKNLILQDCDDDGESHAGGRLLQLLEILNLTNTMVVVTRWYGGIHLGPDRFKHINNAGRQALVKANFLSS